MKVELENLSKRWGDAVGADSMNLEIEDGEFVAFLGPSGCGKTTTLLIFFIFTQEMLLSVYGGGSKGGS